MPRTVIPILGEHFPTNSKVRSVQECVNFYLEEDKSQQRYIAIGTPGLELWADLNGSVVRGAKEHKGVGYVVVDDKLYTVVDKNTITEVGTLSTSVGHVSIAAINDQIGIVDGDSLYLYVVSTATFSTPGDADIPSNPETITSINEYFIIPTPNDNTFYVSDLSDGSSWNALSFASADVRADNIIAVHAVNTIMWVFCEKSVEVFYNSGGPTVPFDRAVAGAYEFGCAAKHTPVSIDNITYWLAANSNGIVGVVRSEGGFPEIISNRAMIQKISEYENTSDAFGWSYQENGHPFYMLTFPRISSVNGQDVGITWAYDLSTNLWSVWESQLPGAVSAPQKTRHLTNCHMFFKGEHIVGDYSSGKLYKISPDVYTENGEEIRRKIITGHFVSTDLRLSMQNLVIETESGSGLAGTGQGSDPALMLRYSKDRGRTWSNQLSRKTGKIGEYNTRATWNRIGSARSITLEITCTDPIKWTILGATALMDVESA